MPLPCPSCGYDLSGHGESRLITCPERGGVCESRAVAEVPTPTPRRWTIGALATPLVMLGIALAAQRYELNPPLVAVIALGFAWALYFDARKQLYKLGISPTRAQRAGAIASATVFAATYVAVSCVILWFIAALLNPTV
jgi:hypothetical protein